MRKRSPTSGVARPRSSTTNPRTIVTSKEESTGQVVWNASFKDRMDFYGWRSSCAGTTGRRTKGKVESGVKYVKGNALAGRRFRDLEDLQYLPAGLVPGGGRRAHPRTTAREAVGALCAGGDADFGRGPVAVPARAGGEPQRAARQLCGGGDQPLPGASGVGGPDGGGEDSGAGGLDHACRLRAGVP